MARPSHKQALIDASLEVFRRQGFNGSSVQDLTDAASVPKGSFYNHFHSKEELAMEALRLYASENGIDVLLDTRHPPLERLKRHFEANWKSFKDRSYSGGCFLGALSSEIADTHEKARVQFERYFAAWSQAIETVLEEAKTDGSLTAAADPARAARFVLNSWQGALLRGKVEKSEGAFQDFTAVVFQELLR